MNHERHQPDELSSSLWDDPVIEEVRGIRRKLWVASGRNIRRFIEQSRQSEERRAAERPRDEAG